VVAKNTRRAIPLVSATLTIVGSVIAYRLTDALGKSQSWAIIGAWIAAGIVVTYLLSRLQARSQEESPEAIKERVGQLEPELRKQVQARSYGARRHLIEAPLRELDLDITPRLGWVRDPRLLEPEPTPEQSANDIVAAFESSRRRMLIVGEPGSGKTMAAYSLIEHLDETEGDQLIPLLVNISAWEAQDDFETFLVDYLCSSVGYEVRERAVAGAFVGAGRYSLILDGLDEIPVELRSRFSERLDEFVRGLPGEVGVVVTCRTQEYEELLGAHHTGLGLVQAVEILPLSSEQLDSALAEVGGLDEGWQAFLSQRHLGACQRARDVLSSPLFLNLALAGRLRPGQLLECSEEQEVRDLVLDGFLDRTLAEQRECEPEDASRYLGWIARFLDGDKVSPFGLKTSDYTVFDLADLTPADPPMRYRVFAVLAVGLFLGLLLGLVAGLDAALSKGQAFMDSLMRLISWLFGGLFGGLFIALFLGLVLALVSVVWKPFKRAAVSSRVTLVWPSTGRRLLAFLGRFGRGLGLGLVVGLAFGLVVGLVFALGVWLGGSRYVEMSNIVVLGMGLVASALAWGLALGLMFGLFFGLVLALGSGLLETRSVLLTSRTPKEARSRSLIAALTWLASGLIFALVLALVSLVTELLDSSMTPFVLGFGLGFGLILALRNGGWFVLLQKVAQRRLARAGNLPPRPYDFLEWGIDKQIFRRVGGGVRFRHSLIQQHLAREAEVREAEARREMEARREAEAREAEARREMKARRKAEIRSKTRGPKLALAGVFLALPIWDTVRGMSEFSPNLVFVQRLLYGLLWSSVDLLLDLLILAVTMLVVSGVVYLFLRRRQAVTFREAIFNWPMDGVAALVALVLLFTDFGGQATLYHYLITLNHYLERMST
jgi:hypothetical protein